MKPEKPTGAEIRQTFIDFFVEHGHTHRAIRLAGAGR